MVHPGAWKTVIGFMAGGGQATAAVGLPLVNAPAWGIVRHLRAGLAHVALALVVGSTAVHAADGTWTSVTGGPWTTASNWAPGSIATGVDGTAFFTAEITSDLAVTLGGARTIGNITFTDGVTPSNDMEISGVSILTLDVSAGLPVIDVMQLGRTLRINSQISGNDGLHKIGPGVLQLTNPANNYTGAIRMSDGFLTVTSSSLLGGGPNLVLNGGTIRVVPSAPDALSKNISLTENGGRISVGGSGLLTVNGTFAASGDGDRTLFLRGELAASLGEILSMLVNPTIGTLAVHKEGDSTWTISGSNTHSGGTTVSGGTLAMGHANALGSTSGQLTVNGGTLNMNAQSLMVGNLTGTGGTIRGTSGSLLLTIGQGDFGGGDYQGIIANGTATSVALTKAGTGMITLSGANTYTGATNVNAGTLVINSLGSTHISSAVAVANLSSALVVNGTVNGTLATGAGTTLSGLGTIGGATTIAGTHSPGNSPGIQTFENNLTYLGGSNVVWELIDNTTASRGTNFDGINVNGALTFNPTTTLNLSFNGTGSTVDWNDVFWNNGYVGTAGWLVSSGASSLAGFDDLDLSSPASWLDTTSASLNSIRPNASFSLHQEGNNIFLNYVAVPEPSTALLGGLGLLGVMAACCRSVRSLPGAPIEVCHRPASAGR